MSILDFLKKGKTNNREAAASQAPKQGQAKDLDTDDKSGKKTVKSEKKESIKIAKKDTKNAYKHLLKPLVTEKATFAGVYNFMIDGASNKQEIKKAIFAVYGVKPRKVNIINSIGKNVRFGKTIGTQKKWKKAIVYLNKKDKIDIWE